MVVFSYLDLSKNLFTGVLPTGMASLVGSAFICKCAALEPGGVTVLNSTALTPVCFPGQPDILQHRPERNRRRDQR